jgi:exodeoxyribonuclease VIII
MNNKEYHASPAVSNSKLSRFLESPRLMNTPRKKTPSLRWGSLVHTIILEPQLIGDEWAVMPEGLDKGKGAKAREEEFLLANEGKEIVSHDEFTQLSAIAAAVQQDDEAAALLAGEGVNESSYFWKDAITGIDMRCRPDRYRDDGLLVDVKTTTSVEHYAFRRSVWDFGYDRQSALYTDGIEAMTGRRPRGFAFIAIEGKDAPEIFVQVFVMTEADIEIGRKRYRKALDLMDQYNKTFGPYPEKWPHKTGPGVIEVDLSKFNV